MSLRPFVRPPTLLFLALWLVLLAGGRSRFFQDSDTFWHTVVGQKILSDGFIDTDSFTFTHAGQRWIPNQWLGEVLFASAHAIDGLDTLLLLTATLLAALFTWLGVRLMRSGLHPALAAVLVALAMAASSGHFHIRPHLATMAGFAITVAFLCDFEAKRISLARMAWLIPIYMFWSNTHGGMLGGLATFALALAGWMFYWKRGWKSPVGSARQLAILGLIWLGCAASAFVNPYGWRLPYAWLDIYRMQSLPQLIKEHSSLDLHDRNAWMVLLFGGIYLGLLLATRPRPNAGAAPRVVWLLPLIWFALGCDRVRHAPLFAIAALIAIADFFPQTTLARNWQARGSDLFIPPEPDSQRKRVAGFVLPVAAVVVSLCLQAARIGVPVVGHDWARLDPQIWPTELLDDLRAHQHDRTGGTRIFNEYAYGGFLIYHVPGYRVFVDGRSELFGDASLNEFLTAGQRDPGAYVRAAEKRYGPFDLALVANQESPCFADYFRQSADWTEVRKTGTAILFKRKGSN